MPSNVRLARQSHPFQSTVTQPKVPEPIQFHPTSFSKRQTIFNSDGFSTFTCLIIQWPFLSLVWTFGKINLHQRTQRRVQGENFCESIPLFDVYYMGEKGEDKNQLPSHIFPICKIFFPPVKYFSITILSAAAEPPHISWKRFLSYGIPSKLQHWK